MKTDGHFNRSLSVQKWKMIYKQWH